MVASVKCAWGLVRERLKDHGGYKYMHACVHKRL